MSEESKETLIHTNTILEAINGLRQEMNERFNKVEERIDKVEGRINNIEARLSCVENEITDMKNLQLSFDVRLDRLELMAHEALQVAYSVRADVKVLRAEVTVGAGRNGITAESRLKSLVTNKKVRKPLERAAFLLVVFSLASQLVLSDAAGRF